MTKPSARSNREFPEKIRRLLGERVAYMCSNPLCRRLTIKASAEDNSSTKQGKASHICAAAKGPRFRADQTDTECRSFDNGIWLCDICAREIDDNESAYSESLLRQWKRNAEQYVAELVTQDTRLRQLRDIVMPLLSALRILSAVPGPGPRLDQTFRDAGYIPLPRLFIEAEQLLFENGFEEESQNVRSIADDLTTKIVPSIAANKPNECLVIAKWKDVAVRKLMLDVMRYSEASYQRYWTVESGMVTAHIAEVRHIGVHVRDLAI